MASNYEPELDRLKFMNTYRTDENESAFICNTRVYDYKQFKPSNIIVDKPKSNNYHLNYQ